MEEKEFNLQLYKGKDEKYRWRFLINGDIKCVGTDPSETIDEAFADAKEILENIWTLGEMKK